MQAEAEAGKTKNPRALNLRQLKESSGTRKEDNLNWLFHVYFPGII